ncbi:hypothetical protein DOA99_09160 [Salmonella enterica subsp. houtenae]|nr:hypothetical protein [Salmonella enterica subsp. houtenae]ECJ2523954.1 hypothetical protein [Salmonella enterica subsp. houtenae]
MKDRIKITIPFSEENKSFLEFVDAWDQIIPTCYFVDICCVGNIKNSAKYLLEENVGTKKFYFIKSLERIDLKHNTISYFPALMEKVSDFYNDKSIQRLKEEAKEDLNALRCFFKNARVMEDTDFTNMYIEGMKSHHPEVDGEKYHQFLSFTNESGIIDPVSPDERLDFVRLFCEQANRLTLDKRSVVFVSSVACIYGCLPARRLMKFKRDPTKFNSSNVLADLQSVSRVARLSSEIECTGRSAFARFSYLTEDNNLKILYDCFFVRNVERETIPNGISNKLTTTIDGKRLFPALFNSDGYLINEKAEQEFNELLTLLGVDAP